MLQWATIVLCVVFLAGAVCSVAQGAEACNPDEGLQARLVRHEGWRSCAYEDTLSNMTIGVGHLLKRPVPDGLCWKDSKVLAVFHHDIERAEANAKHDLDANGVWASLRRGPREVLIEMSFQLGGRGLLHFKRMLAAVRSGDLAAAADEMLDSRWAKQTPKRAQELACIMRGTP